MTTIFHFPIRTVKNKIFLISGFCLSLLVYPLINSYSQDKMMEGMIISLEGDTIFGSISQSGELALAKECLFRASDSDSIQSFKPYDIYGFRFTKNGRFYISGNVLREDGEISLFVEYLLNGVVDLYYFRDFNGEHYLIDKGSEDKSLIELVSEDELVLKDGVYYEKKGRQYVGMLIAGFADQPSLFPEIEELKFHKNSILDITHKYHDLVCEEGEECVVYEKQKAATVYSLGISAGVGVSKIVFRDDVICSANSIRMPVYIPFGIDLNFRPGKFRKSVYYNLSFRNNHMDYSAKKTVVKDYYSVSKSWDIQSVQNSLNFGVGFTDYDRKINRFIMPGIGFHGGEMSVNTISDYKEGDVNTIDEYDEDYRFLCLNIFLRTGFVYPVNDNFSVASWMEGSMLYGTAYERTMSSVFFQQNYKLMFGCYFNL